MPRPEGVRRILQDQLAVAKLRLPECRPHRFLCPLCVPREPVIVVPFTIAAIPVRFSGACFSVCAR
eukprot:SAG31_NODE_4042_length_3642_cov_2.065481_2_plen_66_part_00